MGGPETFLKITGKKIDDNRELNKQADSAAGKK